MNTSDGQSTIELSIDVIGGDDIDDEAIDSMARSLRLELDDIPGTERIELAQGSKPAAKGTKSTGEILTIGALLAAIAPQAISPMIQFLKEWVLRPGNRPLKIKTQDGDRVIEVEFDPRTISDDKVKELTSQFQAMVKKD